MGPPNDTMPIAISAMITKSIGLKWARFSGDWPKFVIPNTFAAVGFLPDGSLILTVDV
jgi:hypothetical protein